MKMYEQRGHDSNKGDVFAYDAIYRLTGVKFNSPGKTGDGGSECQIINGLMPDSFSFASICFPAPDKDFRNQLKGWHSVFHYNKDKIHNRTR